VSVASAVCCLPSWLPSLCPACRSNSEETISTLKFADRAKQVMVQAVVNESRPVDYALVKRLQQEVEMLKALLKRVVQSQNPGSNSAAGGAVNVNTAIFNAKLKQASSAAEIGELLNVSGGGGNTSVAGGPGTGMSMGSPYGARNPSRTFSPDVARGGSGGSGGQGSDEAGGGLEYVMSLEKALNQEQIHAQHLNKKNETLIKELEELKFQNMQLQHQQQGGPPLLRGAALSGGGLGAIGHTSPAPLTKQISINSLAITSGQVTQVIDSVQGLLKENSRVLEQVDQVQKIMKKFFKFQIEEEDMKKSLETVINEPKECYYI
jgi:hypothetical protein